MDGFTRRKERIKESIMNAALELFYAHGFKKVSIDEIAKKADVSPVSIYNHFGSKQGLVKEVLKRLFDHVHERQRSIIEADVPYYQKMQNMLAAKMNAAYEFQGEHFQMDMYNDPDMQQYINEFVTQKSNKLVMQFFDEGKKEGYINPDISSQAILTYIELFQLGWSSLKSLPKGPDRLSKMIHDLQILTLYGFMGKPDAEPKFGNTEKGKL